MSYDIIPGIVHVPNRRILETSFVVAENGLILICTHLIHHKYSQQRGTA
ncbi:MAG: hypothetical protein ACJ788_00590 [Ktedonobacteraceae bacterium]